MYNEIDRTCKQVGLLVHLETDMLKLEIGNRKMYLDCVIWEIEMRYNSLPVPGQSSYYFTAITIFKQPKQWLYTWVSPGRGHRKLN